MKKLIFFALLLLAWSIFTFSCKKDDTVYNAYFYSKAELNQSKLFLYIDGNYNGELKYLVTTPTCDNDESKRDAFYVKLPAGKYKITTKNEHGIVKNESELKFDKKSISGSGTLGGDEVSHDGNCLVMGFY